MQERLLHRALRRCGLGIKPSINNNNNNQVVPGAASPAFGPAAALRPQDDASLQDAACTETPSSLRSAPPAAGGAEGDAALGDLFVVPPRYRAWFPARLPPPVAAPNASVIVVGGVDSDSFSLPISIDVRLDR